MNDHQKADVVAGTRSTYGVIADQYAARWGGAPDWLVAEVDRIAALLAEGEGERWEEVPYQPDVRRWYVYYRLEDLAGLLGAAGFAVCETARRPANRDWLSFYAQRV